MQSTTMSRITDLLTSIKNHEIFNRSATNSNDSLYNTASKISEDIKLDFSNVLIVGSSTPFRGT